jgi:hypothetical protein
MKMQWRSQGGQEASIMIYLIFSCLFTYILFLYFKYTGVISNYILKHMTQITKSFLLLYPAICRFAPGYLAMCSTFKKPEFSKIRLVLGPEGSRFMRFYCIY